MKHLAKRVALRPKGFTLVELMVAIVIVALLATIGAITAQSMITRAKETKCMSNMRNIGVALHIYASDNGERFPETYHTTSLDKAWIEALEPYLGEYDKVRISPGDPRGNERLAAGGTSYVLNSFLFVPEFDEEGSPIGPPLNRIASIPDPSRTLLAFVCADRVGTGPGNDHTHSDLWNNWNAVCADIAPGRFAGEEDPRSAKGRSNYLYADGRVESIRATEMKRKTDSGLNIALPPGLP